MTTPITIDFAETDIQTLATLEGCIAVAVPPDGKLYTPARRLNRLMRGAIERLVQSPRFEKAKPGEAIALAFPTGLTAHTVLVSVLPRRPTIEDARKAGAALAKARGTGALTVCTGPTARAEQVALGLALRGYSFTDHKTADDTPLEGATFLVAKSDEVRAAYADLASLADGVFFTRDLVNAPANILTTETFADKLAALSELGVEVEVLEEADLEKLGMKSLLAVGMGSESPSKVVVMSWNGGAKDAAPLALVGKGVVFDTGGISLKPAGGMEDMTMDMGGAGTVAGVMKAVAGRKAKANVVALVGLVENMPDGRAQRPGDVVTSMKGDTIEVINTDAEGRLVLCDVLWYAQERFKPAAMVDLATLTGAIIIGLGHDNAGVFSNNDAFAARFLKAARIESEGAWQMPMGQAYDDQLKSRIADMKNVGTRAAGSITAAQFLRRFVKDDVPWIHLDIAGTASVKSETALAPKGATGWGVLALDRLIRDDYEV